MTRLCAGIGVLYVLAGCDGRLLDDDPPLDREPPDLVIEAPERAAIVLDDVVTVRGRVEDPGSGIASVIVAGKHLAPSTSGAFEVEIPVGTGINLLETVAVDQAGNSRRDTRAVLAGPFADPSASVPEAVALSLGPRGIGNLARAVTGFFATADLTALAAALNPVIDTGGSCLGATASVDHVSVAAPSIELHPTAAGLEAQIEADDVRIEMLVEYAIACLSGSALIEFSAQTFELAGVLDAAIARGEVAVAILDTRASFQGVRVDLGLLPAEAIELLVDVDEAAASLFATAIEALVPALIEDQFRRFSSSEEFEVLDVPLELELRPRIMRLDEAGLAFVADLAFRPGAGHEAAPYPSPGSASPLPSLHTDDLALVVRQAAVNQALSALWSAGAMSQRLRLGSGDDAADGPPRRLDGLALEMLLPPAITPREDRAAVEIGVGDVLVDALREDGETARVLTRVALSAQLDLSVEVEATPEGERGLRFALSTPGIAFQVLDESGDALDLSEVENLVSFAATRLTAALGDLLGELPLPSVGGVRVRDASAVAEGDFIIVCGELAPTDASE